MAEWSQECKELQVKLENFQKECLSYMTEVYKLKTAYEETQDHLETV